MNDISLKMFRTVVKKVTGFLGTRDTCVFQIRVKISPSISLCRRYSTVLRSDRKLETKRWNEAASVLIAAPLNNSEPFSIGFLMVERSRTTRVMPGMNVFPGGNVDPVDSSPKWLEMFKDMQNVDISNENFFHDGAHIPQIYDMDDKQPFSKQVSLRITAIREVFEETGLLLCKPRSNLSKEQRRNYYEFDALEDKKELKVWQKKVRKDSENFVALCRNLDCVPDIYALHDWNNWLTPTNFKPKSRFDTMFFLIILPKLLPVVIDSLEVTKSQWITPSFLISEHSKGHMRLMPPQIYEFTRMQHVKTIGELQDRLNIRKKLGIERYFPVVKNVEDGVLFLLPGDDLYPDPPDFIGEDPSGLDKIPKTIDYLKESSKNLHRGVAKSNGVISKYEINVTRFGHIY